MAGSAGLVLAFGATSIFREQILLEEVKRFYPNAYIFGCSTAGEIYGTHVLDGSLCITAIGFEHTQCRGARVKLSRSANSLEAGRDLAQAISPSVPSLTPGKTDELAHIFVLSDGLKVNGSDLVCGLTEQISEKVTITGGLAGDGDRFGETLCIVRRRSGKRCHCRFGPVREQAAGRFWIFGRLGPFRP